jgi:signal transduction histidine kinase
MSDNINFETELRAANEVVYKHSLELARLKQALEIANEQQKGLLHFISHEIKGFLTKGQNAFAAIVEGDYGEVSPEVKELSVGALGEMRKGVSTVMDILDASNLKKGTITFDKKPFDLKTAVEGVCGDLKKTAEAKGLCFICDIGAGEFKYTGDEAKLRRHVFRNLVDNSIRYTPTGTISVGLHSNNNVMIFTVKDTGVGITSEDMPKLFTEGGHGKDSIKVNVDSTGYGLFVAKQVTVRRHWKRI